MSTLEFVKYYVNLLIIQYAGKPKAEGTVKTNITPVLMPQTSVQKITFSSAPSQGYFVLSWNGEDSYPIAWDDSASDIQASLRVITGLEQILVTGEISDLTLAITFVGVDEVAELLVVEDNTLEVSISIKETDLILPLAIESGFNLTGDETAVGAQLDILGKYAGVTRVGQTNTSSIILDDDDYLSLIKMKIITNSSGSSLATIQELIHGFFEGNMLVFDYQNMKMTYFVSYGVGSRELIDMFLLQGLLPKPMGVQVNAIIYAPSVNNFFGFRTYEFPAPLEVSPFNTYADYQLDFPWLSYAYSF